MPVQCVCVIPILERIFFSSVIISGVMFVAAQSGTGELHHNLSGTAVVMFILYQCLQTGLEGERCLYLPRFCSLKLLSLSGIKASSP